MATRRGYYREELERAVANIEMSLTHLARVIEAYEPQHPEVSANVLEIGNALTTLAELIQAVHDQI